MEIETRREGKPSVPAKLDAPTPQPEICRSLRTLQLTYAVEREETPAWLFGPIRATIPRCP